MLSTEGGSGNVCVRKATLHLWHKSLMFFHSHSSLAKQPSLTVGKAKDRVYFSHMKLNKYNSFVRQIRHHAFNSQDVRVCSKILVPTLFYPFVHQLWANRPGLFPIASALDEIINAVALGYISSYVFFILVIVVPRTMEKIRKIEIARSHILTFDIILKSFENDTGINVINENSHSFLQNFIRKRMFSKTCSISLSNHLGGWEQHSYVTLSSFVRRVALKVQYSCPILQEMIGDDEQFYRAIERVQYLAFEVQNPNPDIPEKLHGYGDISYPGLLIQLGYLVEEFNEEHGL